MINSGGWEDAIAGSGLGLAIVRNIVSMEEFT
jgi:signal transduction histidine kinase